MNGFLKFQRQTDGSTDERTNGLTGVITVKTCSLTQIISYAEDVVHLNNHKYKYK